MDQTILYNDRGQPFTIQEVYTKNGRSHACVKFLDTGTIDHFRTDTAKKGQIKDRYAKSIMGMFSIGKAKKINNKKEYNLWHHMLERCYEKSSRSYRNYGEKGITVCERWHCFEHFLEDIPLIDGYDEDLFKKGLLELDKDIKQKEVVGKIYSLDTCTFVTAKENKAHRDTSKMNKLKAIAYKEDKVIYIHNIPSFAKENKMSNSGIYECLSGKKDKHNGWRFEFWEQ